MHYKQAAVLARFSVVQKCNAVRTEMVQFCSLPLFFRHLHAPFLHFFR